MFIERGGEEDRNKGYVKASDMRKGLKEEYAGYRVKCKCRTSVDDPK